MSDDPQAEARQRAEEEAGRVLFAGDCTFVKGVVDLKHLPVGPLPEVAFAGRSNVGKSTLLNALTNRKTLARTSNTPGRTRELNFFDLGARLMLVDLPGYGYARISKSEVERWTKLTRNYLKGRQQLARVFLLIDSRHGIKANDQEIMDEFDEAAVIYQVVLTKIDKLKVGQVKSRIAHTQELLANRPAAHPEVIPVSSVKGDGIAELRAAATLLALAESAT